MNEYLLELKLESTNEHRFIPFQGDLVDALHESAGFMTDVALFAVEIWQVNRKGLPWLESIATVLPPIEAGIIQ